MHLILEKAPDPAGPWTPVAADSLPGDGTGGMVDLLDGPEAFFRMQIEEGDPVGGALGMPLAMAPAEARQIAGQHLESLRFDEPEWSSAVLGNVAIPIYNPAVGSGDTPAWIEFRVIPGKLLEPMQEEEFPHSDPLEPPHDCGYILVTVGRHDVPVPQYATSGKPPSERLRRLAGTSNVRLFRYMSDFWAAEDGKGQLLASLGSTPFQMPAEILDWIGIEPVTEVEGNEPISQGPKPKFQPLPYQSYEAFRNDYIGGPVYTWLRMAAEKDAALDWAAQEGKEPPTIRVPIQEQVLVLSGVSVKAFDLEDPIAQITIEPKGGLRITGLNEQCSVLQVIGDSGSIAHYVLVVGNPILPAGWTSWSTSYAGGCADPPRYVQEWGLSGCCSRGWSGCGATAWAIFYGYWDSRGAPALIGGTGATPYNNTDDVRACIRRVFTLADSWCTAVSGQAATNPWDMDEGWRWAQERGETISMTCSWSVPYTSSGPRNRARRAIRDDRRPAIVGTGYFAHFPFAYGYRQREYRTPGVTWRTQRQWRVYQGWGGSGCEWVNANSCWFGMNARCW